MSERGRKTAQEALGSWDSRFKGESNSGEVLQQIPIPDIVSVEVKPSIDLVGQQRLLKEVVPQLEPDQAFELISNIINRPEMDPVDIIKQGYGMVGSNLLNKIGDKAEVRKFAVKVHGRVNRQTTYNRPPDPSR